MKQTHRLSRLSVCLTCALMALGTLTELRAQVGPVREPLPNYDKRLGNRQNAPEIAPERKAALARFKAQVGDAEVTIDKLLGSPRFIHSRHGFLTGPLHQPAASQGGGVTGKVNDRHQSVKSFLNEHKEMFGHGAEVLNTARIKREHVDSHNGMRTVVWQQEVDGIPVFEQIFKAHITRNGELVNVSSHFIPDVEKAADKGHPNRAKLRQNPSVSAERAVVGAGEAVGETLRIDEVKALGVAPGHADDVRVFDAPGLKGETYSRLTWVALDESTLRLCWEIFLTSATSSEMFQVLIDAETAQPVIRRCLTAYISDATYNVYTSDSPSPFSPGHSTPSTVQPPIVSRTSVTTNAISVVASPNGWINDGDNETIGNNVDAHLDRNDDNQPDLPRPQGVNRVFDFPLDLTKDPGEYGDAAVVNLFYWNNWMHDKLYELGFTEAAGNFQMDNFGRGGFGNDPVRADAQDGLDLQDIFHENNANMATPPDGFPPRMQMYMWSAPTPHRDGDLDAEIILHEYTHGLSNRRVGGGVGISELQSAGMGEGWSDFYALALLSQPSDDINGNYGVGAYSLFQSRGSEQNYYFGIRRYPYSTDLTKSPLTFKDIDPTQISSHPGVPRSPRAPFDPTEASSVHRQGEVWCGALWEVRANLIGKHGYAVGNQLALQLVTDGMTLSPANPNFLQARDAILQADLVNNGGANFPELWRGFAKRGMGSSASSPDSSTTTGVVEAFDMPGLAVDNVIIGGGNGNGKIDFNECNEMQITLVNRGAIPATGVSGRLSTTTPGVFIVQSFSPYSNIPSGGSAINATLFKVSTSPEFVCGTQVQFTFVIKSDQETRTNSFSIDTGTLATPSRFDNNSVVVIPDNSAAGITSPINVSGISSAIGKVAVSLHITHTFDADLILKLTAPDGTTVTLSQNNGGAGDNYGSSCNQTNRTTFDDSAANSISVGIPPFLGTFRPEQSLAAFSGKSGAAVNGVWQLSVSDVLAIDLGSLQCWSLFLYPADCTDGGGECPGVDLAVGMRSAPDPVMVGSNLVYTISVTNNGPNTAKGVVLNQSLPNSVIFVSGTSSQGNVSHAGGFVNANLGNMPIGAIATVNVTVITTAAGNISSTATVASNDSDFDLSNNTASIISRVNPPAADLAVSIVDSPDPALVGGVLTYTVTVTNNGPSTANSVSVTNVLPATAAFVSASTTQGSISSQGTTVIGSLGTITNGGSAVITINVTPTANGTLTASSKVGAVQFDPNPANNTSATATTVNASADLVLTIVDSPDPVVVGSNLTYTITVSNRGPSTATSVVVSDTLSPNVSFVSSTQSQGIVTPPSGNVINWNVGTLGSGGAATLSILVTTVSSVTVVNSATVSGSQSDPNSANNSVSITTVVKAPFISVVPAGALLTGETQTNGAVDFGETVTISFFLENRGNVNTTNVVATLLATGGVTSPSSSQSYGVLTAGGISVSKPFTFTAANSGSNVVATLQLQDGANNLGQVTYTFVLPRTVVFTNATAIAIQDATSANPYPSTIVVSNLSGVIGNVTATVAGMSHTYPDDVDILLAAPGNQSVVLMSDAGGDQAMAGITFTLADDAIVAVPDSGSIVSTVYKPADYEPGEEFAGAPAGIRSSTLAGFNGTSPNGTWSLYVMDDSSGDVGSIAAGWRLTLTMITPVNPVADIAVTVTDSPDPILLGQNLTYVFTVTNSGPNLRRSVVFTNSVPASMNIVSATSSQGACVVSGNVITASLDSIPASSNATVTVVVTPTLPGSISNTAVVTGGPAELDPYSGNNSATATSTVLAPSVDLVLNAAGPSSVVVNSNATYTITFSNRGPQTAYSVVITNILPSDATYVSASSSVIGTITTVACDGVSCKVRSTLGTLAPGATGTLTIVAALNSQGTAANSINIATVSQDTDGGNNSVTVETTVTPPLPIIIAAGATLVGESIAPQNGAIDAGEVVTVRFALANVGAVNTGNLVATLQASGGVTPNSPPQSYGALVVGGSAVGRTFSFSAADLPSVTATLQLQDGSTDLGTISYTFNLPTSATVANGTTVTIPSSGSANVYPSTISVSGRSGLISKVTVTLSNLTHSFPDDLDLLLVSPSGQKVVLMSDAGGGGSLTNVTLVFSDNGVSLPDATRISSGTFKPTDFEAGDFFPAPAPAGGYDGSLASFNGSAANGNWSLYVVDDATGDAGSLNGGWSLAITTVETVNPAANLAVTMSASPASVFVADNITYEIQVHNHGPALATNVVVTDSLPIGTAYVSAGSSQGSVSTSSGLVTFNLGSIAPGAQATALLVLRATAAGEIINSVNVTGAQTDLNLVNNSAQAAVAAINYLHARLRDTTMSSEKHFSFSINGHPGSNYVIQASGDLISWDNVSTNKLDGSGAFEFVDTNAPAADQKYYRAILLEP